MRNLRFQVRITMVLGLVTLLAGLFAHLALTDIYHGEKDLALEWRVLQVAAAVILVFTVSTLVTLRRVLHELVQARSDT